MTLTEIISRAKALRTMHGETLPPPGPQRDAWAAERELLNRFINDADQ